MRREKSPHCCVMPPAGPVGRVAVECESQNSQLAAEMSALFFSDACLLYVTA